MGLPYLVELKHRRSICKVSLGAPWGGAVTKYKHESKMAEDRKHVLIASAILAVLSSLAAAFQLCGLLINYLVIKKRQIEMAGPQAVNQYDLAVARLRNAPRQACRRGRVWRKPGRTKHWWHNLFNGVLPESEWKLWSF